MEKVNLEVWDGSPLDYANRSVNKDYYDLDLVVVRFRLMGAVSDVIEGEVGEPVSDGIRRKQ